MPTLPSLTVADVRSWADDRDYKRGERYFREGRVRRPRRTGRTLRAYCQGSRPSPYRVEVRLGDDGVAAASCSCPVGGDGRCKHVVALLLTWVEAANTVAEVRPLPDRLRSRSTDDLVALVDRLSDRLPGVARAADLLLHLPVKGPDAARDYVGRAFDAGRLPGDADYGSAVAEHLDPLLEQAREALAAERRRDATGLFRAVSEAVMARYDASVDDAGALRSVVDTCAGALHEVLHHAEDSDRRRPVVHTLLSICRWDAGRGGQGPADSAAQALADATSATERRRVADRLRDLLSLDTDDAPDLAALDAWDRPARRRHTLGDLFLSLTGDQLNDDAYRRVCRRTGQWRRLAEHLIAQGRPDDAVRAAAPLPDTLVPRLADRLVAAGAPDTAVALVEDRLDDAEAPTPLLRWLYQHATANEQPERTLAAARRLFWQQPTPDAYDRVRAAAEQVDQWSEVRTELHEWLEGASRAALRVRLYLHEGDPDAALALVAPLTDGERDRPFSASFRASVADAVADTHPEAALALYDEAARHHIAQRGRDHYATAADLLRRARSVCDAADLTRQFTDRLDALHDDELHRLPAARDEFADAGLL